MAQFEIKWEAPEFEYREKDVSWYWITIIVAAACIAFSVWQRDFLFGFFVVVAEILLIVWGNQVPRMIDFSLDENYIHIGNHKSHSLKEFETWSAEEIADGWMDISFNFRTRLKPPLRIIAPHALLEQIRKDLKPILREVEHEVSLIDAIEKLLRF